MPRHDILFISYVNGVLLCLLAGGMLIPALVDFAGDNPDGTVFLLAAVTTGTCGAFLVLANRGVSRGRLHRRSIYLLTVSLWIVLSVFASLPLLFSSLKLSLVDALFETVSGITTTGSTVIAGLDNLPPGLLLWRSLIQWFGGIGIVVLAMIVLPELRIGGMQLFHSESSDISDKFLPRAYDFAKLCAGVYFLLTFLCAFALVWAGMPVFDAVNHAMTTLATGGYSTKDASVGFYDSVPIEIVLTVFMALGALPLVYFARVVQAQSFAGFRDPQVSGFLTVLAVAILAMTAWNVAGAGMAGPTALRLAAFNVTSVLTDTGFATTDFSTWGSFAVGLFFLLFFVGGCAGSTAGAIKIFRWQILFKGIANQLRTTLSPNEVVLLKQGTRRVDTAMYDSVRAFFFLYLLTFAALSLAVMATGLDFLSSTSAVAQAMANAGPGLGPVVGPASNFQGVATSAKWLLMLAMLLGRLELVTVYVLAVRRFWMD
ncbi:TrkH family potassium uptake protein [Propylenella binzhouense]|uniref:Trk system potassium uptake protein n=1 Tax=Propylenella binzhouense TaxID=2555902 RepID=A0A964T6M1_9HYPH|nr:TrkH family potassium uptake protein [Propylenella binzhouense]MYZ49374.1 TrkH family potassium uptake protein [Propylenella binzhouense]